MARASATVSTAKRSTATRKAAITGKTTARTRSKSRPSQKVASKKEKRTPTKKSAQSKSSSRKYWSQAVTTGSDALDLESGVFAKAKPADIARSLKRSAEASKRRKGTPYQSAMSMLNFYMNRAGKKLPESRKRVLERAKDALRKEFGRE